MKSFSCLFALAPVSANRAHWETWACRSNATEIRCCCCCLRASSIRTKNWFQRHPPQPSLVHRNTYLHATRVYVLCMKISWISGREVVETKSADRPLHCGLLVVVECGRARWLTLWLHRPLKPGKPGQWPNVCRGRSTQADYPPSSVVLQCVKTAGVDALGGQVRRRGEYGGAPQSGLLPDTQACTRVW